MTIKGYKGFEPDMTCRGKQYAENEVFEEETADLCKSGMHFCENPLDVLDFYPLVRNDGSLGTFADVEALGETKTDGKKSVTTKLRIGAKLSFPAFVKAGVDFMIERTKIETPNETDKNDNGKDGAQIGSSGNDARIGSSGYGAQIGSSGYGAQIGSSGYGARIGSSGNGARIGSSGNGARIGSSGENCVICCAGNDCVVKAKKGSWITLSEWKWKDEKYVPVCVKTEFVDGERIKSDTPYMLKDGAFVEVDE